MSNKRECPHCHGSLERYEDPKAVEIIAAMKAERDRAHTALIASRNLASRLELLCRVAKELMIVVGESTDFVIQLRQHAWLKDANDLLLGGGGGFSSAKPSSAEKQPNDEADRSEPANPRSRPEPKTV